MKVFVSGQPRKSKHRQRIIRKALTLRERKILHLDLGRGNGRESDNEISLVDGNVRGAQMVAELILTREADEEAVEVDLSRAESASVVR